MSTIDTSDDTIRVDLTVDIESLKAWLAEEPYHPDLVRRLEPLIGEFGTRSVALAFVGAIVLNVARRRGQYPKRLPV